MTVQQSQRVSTDMSRGSPGVADPTKRQRSLQSLQSSQSICSKPPVPSKKKPRLAEDMAPNDPYADLALAFDREKTQQSAIHNTTANEPIANLTSSSTMDTNDGNVKISDTPLARSRSPNPFEDPRLDADMEAESGAKTQDYLPEIQTAIASGVPGTRRSDDREEITAEILDEFADDMSWASSYISTYEESSLSQIGNENTDEQLALPGRWGSVDDIMQLAQQIDSNRPIDTFSEDEIANIKLAADYLQCLYFDEDAFALYALVIKRYQADPFQQRRTMFSATISYARSAETTAHCEIVQNLLRLELEKAEEAPSPVERFLIEMLLAYSYARVGCDSECVSDHLNLARSCGDGEDLIAQLPSDDRSLDLLTYLNVVRCLPSNCDLLGHDLYGQEAGFSLKERQLEDAILQRIPGPFEIQDNMMGNPCIWRCLQWCERELGNLTVLPGVWKSMKPNNKYIRSAETIGLFTCLWERWHEPGLVFSKSDLRIWMTETEIRMGISPTELLAVLCWMINLATPWRRSKFDSELIFRLQFGSHALTELTDRELATKFLRIFIRRNSLGYWPRERHALQRVARTHVIGLLQKVLLIILPDLQSASDNGFSTQVQTLSIVAAKILPTLASSLSSTDLASLRTLRDRIQRNASNVIQITRDLPSTVLRDSLRSNLSLPTMSELSQAMASSLSLSNFQQASTSVLNRMARVGSGIGDWTEEAVVENGSRRS